jgi:hypothetical protein
MLRLKAGWVIRRRERNCGVRSGRENNGVGADPWVHSWHEKYEAKVFARPQELVLNAVSYSVNLSKLIKIDLNGI